MLIEDLKKKLIGSKAMRVRFMGDMVKFMADQGVDVKDETLARCMFNGDDAQFVKALEMGTLGIVAV